MSERRRDPDQILRRIQAEEAHLAPGRLKIFLGYASGVGKTFRMLDEGRRRRVRGEDVAVGAIQPRVPEECIELAHNLPAIPMRRVDGVDALDLTAILERHPGVCIVDGLAWRNPAGSRNEQRWQDVEQLLEAGISVITSVNIQYIEEFRERISAITGKQVTDAVPLSFIKRADEIVVVDAPPDLASVRYAEAPAEMRAEVEHRLSQLREIALLLAADVIDQQLETYLRVNGIEQAFGMQERILVCVTPRSNGRVMIESGKRNADRFHGDLIVAYVSQPNTSAEDQTLLDGHLETARGVQAKVEILDGEDAVDVILEFARERGVTQIFVGHSLREKWWQRLAGSPLDRLIRRADGIDVRVFPH